MSRMSLATFTLDELAQYTPEGSFPPDDSPDFRVFYVGRDDVHSILMHLFQNVTLSITGNMFGYDDDELNSILWEHAENPNVVVQVTLDKSQSGGIHEKKILASDIAKDAAKFASCFVIGQSATHQISHTKGFVLDGIVAFEGSTNWSASGEGAGIQLKGSQNSGFKAQNNTLAVYTNRIEIAKFSAQLAHEHNIAVSQQAKSS